MGFKAHFITLVNKNFIRWRRGCLGSVCELLLPIACVGLLFLAYDPADIEMVDVSSNLPDNYYSFRTLDEEINDWPAGVLDFESGWGDMDR